MKNVGIGAAYKGAKILTHYFGNLPEIRKKGPDDLVTRADIESEKMIIDTIRAAYPEHAFMAEESGNSSAVSSCRWIIDPLDGTTNFAHEIPIFAVSIAFAIDDVLTVGIVLNPVSGELFTAVREKGAELNGHPIRVSAQTRLSDSLLVTGFPYDAKACTDPLMTRFERCLSAAQGVRRLGSAAIDLCYVACGRFEGFWEEGLKPWDTAAGALIAREAGGSVTNFSGSHYGIMDKELLATNGHIHKDVLSLLEIENLL